MVRRFGSEERAGRDEPDVPLSTALRVACGAIALNVAVNAAEMAVNSAALSKSTVLIAAIIDLAIVFGILVGGSTRARAQRFAIVRVALGLFFFGATTYLGGNHVGALMQLALSGSLLLLLAGEASRPRWLAGATLNVLVQGLRIVVVVGAMRGYSLLGPWMEGAKYEPEIAEVRGRAYDYRWRLPAGWRAMKPADTDALRLDADRVAARLVRDTQVTVIGSRIRWDQRFDPSAALDSMLANVRTTFESFSLVQRGTLPPPLSSPFIEYRGVPRSDNANTPATSANVAPSIIVLATVVRGSMGQVFTLVAVRRDSAPASVRDECVAALEGFSVRRAALTELPAATNAPSVTVAAQTQHADAASVDAAEASGATTVVERPQSLADALEPVPADGLRGRTAPYRMRVERGWFLRKPGAMEEGQDRALIVPFEDVALSTSVLRIGNAVDAAGTARQTLTRMGATGTPTFEEMALPQGVQGAMLRYRANVGGDLRVGISAVFVRERDSVLVVATLPAAAESERMPEVERMMRSFAFE